VVCCDIKFEGNDKFKKTVFTKWISYNWVQLYFSNIYKKLKNDNKV